MNDFQFIEYANGGCFKRGTFKEVQSVVDVDFYGRTGLSEQYTSVYRHCEEYKTFMAQQDKVAKYSGPIATEFMHFDFDSPHGDMSLIEVRQFVERLCSDDKYRVSIDDFSMWYTGNKGFHIFLMNDDTKQLQPGADLPDKIKKTAIYLAGSFSSFDRSVYDAARLWRVPNTINKKGQLYKIPIIASELFTLPIQAIREISKKQRSISGIGKSIAAGWK
jgi:hypothetical protein